MSWLAARRRNDAEQPFAFAEGEVGRGFVEQQQFRPGTQRAGDLDELALMEIEGADGLVQDRAGELGVDRGQRGGGFPILRAEAVESERPSRDAAGRCSRRP